MSQLADDSRPVEAPEADWQEQQLAADPGAAEEELAVGGVSAAETNESLDVEANPADVLEQQIPAPAPDDQVASEPGVGEPQ